MDLVPFGRSRGRDSREVLNFDRSGSGAIDVWRI